MTEVDRRLTSMMRLAMALVGICFGLTNVGQVEAVPSQMSHEMSGSVQRVDQQAITILPTGASKPEAFVWNWKDTKFFRDGAPITVRSLRVGTQVQIRRSHPIFDHRPFIYRVSWKTKISH